MRILRAIVAAGLTLSTAAAAQQPPAPVTLTVTRLKPAVYEIEGGGSNSLILIGDTGVIVVDAKTTADAGRQLVAEVAKMTPKPITTAIITHSDGDHVNGLAAFPAGITIIAHANNKKEQEVALAAGGRGAPPPDRLPTRVVTADKETMTIDGVKLGDPSGEERIVRGLDRQCEGDCEARRRHLRAGPRASADEG